MKAGVGPFRITCEGNLRKEEDEGKIMGTEEYEFDRKGRGGAMIMPMLTECPIMKHTPTMGGRDFSQR